MSPQPPPPVGTTATRTAPDGTLWQRVVTSVGQYARPNVNYTLTGPKGDVFEMHCQVDVWWEGVADCVLGHTDGAPQAAPPRAYTWDALMALAMSVPKAEWRRNRDNDGAQLGSAYAPLYLDLSTDPTTLQVGSGPRGYTFRDNNLTRAQRDDLRRLSDHVFAPGHDVEAKLAYVFGGDFPR